MCAVFFLILGHNLLVSPTRATQKAPFSNFSSAGFVHLVAKTYFCVMNRFYSCLVFVCSLLLIGCTGSRRQPPEVPRPAPSVYYWRTVLEFSARERDFLRRHHIGKVYLRYFDVAPDQITDEPVPVATLQWRDSVPDGLEIVPVVFIVNSCLEVYVQTINPSHAAPAVLEGGSPAAPSWSALDPRQGRGPRLVWETRVP